MKKRIIDKRRKEKFMVDDEYLNGQAKLCGIYATGIYMVLCRHVDKEQHCFPSIKLISEKLSIGTTTVKKGLKKLEENNIIEIKKTRSKNGKWLNNEYILLDKSEWNYTQGRETSMVNQGRLRTAPGTPQDVTRDARRPLRKHIEGNTYKETHFSKTEFCGKDINSFISLFKEVNILSSELFKNKTERSAAEFLLENVPLKRLEGIMKILPTTNTHTFAPTITKPTELKRNVSKLLAYIEANKDKFNKTKRKA